MNSNLRKAVRYVLMAAAASALTAPAVFAQDAAQSTANQNQNASPAQLGKIEVTGSRIKRTDVETAQPVTIITAQQIQQSGLTTIGDVLQNLTQSGAAVNTLINNGNTGETELDLRYMGANRVLVLVNGRRWTPQLSGTVDLNTIPVSVIDHIEILQDGASAIYGSDAIAGVVNVITIKNYNGAEAHAYLGMYHNTYKGFSHWDGKIQQYDFTLGSQSDRSGVVFDAGYSNQNPIWAGSRAQSAEAIWTQGGGSSTIPGGRYQFWGSALAGQTFGSATCKATGNGACNMTNINSPTNDPQLSNFRNRTGADTYNYALQNYFVTPLETKSIYVQGHYDIADNVTFTSEAMYNDRSSQQTLAPSPIVLGAIGYTANGSMVGIGKNNPYNPFGVDLVGNTSQWCTADGNAPGCSKELLLGYQRRPIEAGNRAFNQDVASYTFRMGLNGFFNMLGSEWDWDIGSIYGNTYQSNLTQGLFDTAKLAIQMDSPGSAQCNGPGVAVNPGGNAVLINGLYYPILTPGCVPWNPFGGYNLATAQGSLTPQMIAYSQYEEHNVDSVTLRDYTANITGDLFQMPAGPFGVAMGLEYLENDGFDHPDSTTSSGNTTGNVSTPTDGKEWSNAEYIEFNIPLLADVPLVHSLNLDLANRWTQIKWKGGEPGNTFYGVQNSASATTGRAAMKWQPTDDLLVRGSWSQGFRAPSLADLYTGQFTNYPSVSDPCAGPPYGSYPGTGPLPPGCNGVVHDQPNTQIVTTGGGNPHLKPEKAISKTIGFVYNPNWLPGFDFSADYYKIELTNPIGGIGAQSILNGCYISQNANYCKLIKMAGNIISNIFAISTNTGSAHTHGIDLSSHYKFPSTRAGDFKLGLNWTFVRSFVNVFVDSTSPTGWSSAEAVGTGGNFTAIPSQKGNISLDWNYGDWSARWFLQYIGSWYEACSATTISMNECSNPTVVSATYGSTGVNHEGRTIYHDVEGTYHVDAVNTDFTFGIRNLFDKEPPATLTAFANSFIPTAGYRVPGRFFYAQVAVKF
ncbi:MAG: TonB-dependent receptor [Gammaproteobacteria bacterium]|nr:TonB-dependent receptor [Gammaproteobacteria bacterium]MBU6509425.1 TonB-dependent receptor [Gammaproteobacteria bacterium]MDE1983701.1 TonB-dependent receptor [Gammaproteobacteria bacterium]MDE2107901.1 TonB-dependent receptor [Gammaproteobacteria bacterium]MDE2460217.1 TonB-dependent receptor [Gammaproteobacteria bacterium]